MARKGHLAEEGAGKRCRNGPFFCVLLCLVFVVSCSADVMPQAVELDDGQSLFVAQLILLKHALAVLF